MLSEYENNLNVRPATAGDRKNRKSSLFRYWGQTFGSKSQHGHRSGCPEISKPRELTPTTNPLGQVSGAGHGTMGIHHGSRRVSRLEPSPKMFQILESNEAEGKV